jgi:hypothetical protein
MRRFLILLGGQGEKNEYLGQLWQILTLKLKRYNFLSWDHAGKLDDLPFCTWNFTGFKSKTLHYYMPSKINAKISIVWFPDIFSIHNLLSDGHSLFSCRFLWLRGHV